MPLHERLWRRSSDLAQRCLEHPFVRGLADGTLPVEAFRRYIAQDAYFLRAFLSAFALCTARSPDAEAAAQLVEMQRGTLAELKLHAAYSRELSIDLVHVRPYPAAAAYCDFLQSTAWHESADHALAAMTPCARLYGYLGGEIARDGIPQHRYADWIRTYSSDDYARHVRGMEALLERLASDTPAVRERYRYAMQCEIDFFSAPLEEIS
jgi:thiaminase/transcriptional activator TenA